MFHIVVVLWLKSTVLTYALPHEYVGYGACMERAHYLSENWVLKDKHNTVGYGCEQTFKA